MSLAVSLHNTIQKCNVLQKPTEQLKGYFTNHSTVHKTALVVAHLFRALPMVAAKMVLPFSTPVSLVVCFLGSVFYRIVVEGHCPFKYAIPSFAGAIAIIAAYPAVVDVINGVAFASLGAFSLAVVSFLPLACYLTYAVLTISYDVDHPPKACH